MLFPVLGPFFLPHLHPSLLWLADSSPVFNLASLGKLWVAFPTLGQGLHLHVPSISPIMGNNDTYKYSSHVYDP